MHLLLAAVKHLVRRPKAHSNCLMSPERHSGRKEVRRRRETFWHFEVVVVAMETLLEGALEKVCLEFKGQTSVKDVIWGRGLTVIPAS